MWNKEKEKKKEMLIWKRRGEKLTRKKKKERGVNLITIERKSKQASEQFRTIRSNINFASINKELKSLVITSPHSGDGKTMTATNLAIVFSQEGKKVLLVDADMRKPTIHHMFRLMNNNGLSNYLVGQQDIASIINPTYLTDLDIVTSGIIPPNPSELLSSTQMEKFMTSVNERYDIIIFDTPPVLVVTDSTLLANLCDGVLLVIRAKKSEISDVKKAKEQLKYAGANLLGAILNGKKLPHDSYYYIKG
jgi:protein-tyrosine kinase